MYRDDRNIEFMEVESFVEPLPAAKEEPAENAGDNPVRIPGKIKGKTPGKISGGVPGKTAAEMDENKPLRAKEFIDGSILTREAMTRQLPFVLFLTLLAVLYIGNRYHAERMVRKITATEMEVKNLRAEQITIASELMNISKPSEVAASVDKRNLGLKPSVEPPKKLVRKGNP
jgi:hypothetical protein